MTDFTPFLKELISAPGLSGHESPVCDLIANQWKPLVEKLSLSPLGSLHGFRRGEAPDPRSSVLISAHMDAIGLMVKGLEEEFLRLTSVGGVDARVLPGQLVTVHGRQDIPGVVVMPPDWLLPTEIHNGNVPIEYLWIDTGLTAQRLARLVRVGDLVSFAQPPLELSGEVIAGHSLDNRVSIVALTHCLQELTQRVHQWDVWVVATVQEEETLGGAATSAFQLRPDVAVVVDVTYGRGPGADDHRTFPLGGGLTLGWGPNVHPTLFKAFKTLAEELEIPYSVEVFAHHSGTDAIALQVTAEGIPTVLLSIPLRYMHTPVEMVMMKDIQRTGRLLAEFIARLGPDFMNKVNMD
ncbi:MAG: M42 family peptidase [Chloroflexota bacterium]